MYQTSDVIGAQLYHLDPNTPDDTKPNRPPDAFAELPWLQERSAEINAVAFLEAEGRSFERLETKRQAAPVLRPEVPGQRKHQSPLPCNWQSN
jgi:hypothetical protein